MEKPTLKVIWTLSVGILPRQDQTGITVSTIDLNQLLQRQKEILNSSLP